MKNIVSTAILFVAIILSLGSCSNNFDINKKGGVRITVEVSEKDIVKALSHDSQDPVFLQAMELAEKRQQETGDDFITLFGEAFKESDHNAKLVSIFLLEFKDKMININSSNDDVLKVLREEIYSADEIISMVLATRLDRYCEEVSSVTHKVKYNIQMIERPGIIQIELPNDERIDLYRIRKLIQGQGKFEFYETFTSNEVYPFLFEANDLLAKTTFNSPNDESETLVDTLIQKQPLFSKLQPDNGTSARVGIALVSDTAAINNMLTETRNLFPRNLKLAWTVMPEIYPDQDSKTVELLDLVALKLSRDNKCALGGEVITEARQEYGQYNQVEVTIQMNAEGAHIWKHLTSDNVGRQIAIVLDDYVYSYPVVNGEIPNGRSSISGGSMTLEEAQDLANVIKSGKYPCQVRIIEETPIVVPNR